MKWFAGIRNRPPHAALWGHRGQDWTPGHEPRLPVFLGRVIAFDPWRPTRVTISSGYMMGRKVRAQTLWVFPDPWV